MRTTTCSCCPGARCVRVRSPDEISFDAALRRLRDKLADERQPFLSSSAPAPRRDARPWEMPRREFDALAEPGIDTGFGTPRFRGLSRSVLRREVQVRLRCPGGPADGYRVRVPGWRADLDDQPHRAFVEAALAEGLSVPGHVLSEYPDLQSGRPPEPSPPRLDFTPLSHS